MDLNRKILEIALSQYGIKEITGKEDNPQVLKYFDILGFNGKELKDETAWCSASANYIAMKAGATHSGALDARSWLEVGLKIDSPIQGDVVVFWRESKKSWKGHVAFYIAENETHIFVLGGNQNNSFCIKPYPKSRLLGYRRMIKDVSCYDVPE